MIPRRDFLRNSAFGIAGLAFSRSTGFSAMAQSRIVDAHIEVLLNEPLGTISPNIYGHFTEDLGGVLDDGIWVGENAKVANVNGIRKSVIDHMRKIKALGMRRKLRARRVRYGISPLRHLGSRLRAAASVVCVKAELG